MDLAPDSSDAQVALASLLLETGHWADAERQLQIALRELPNDGRLHAMLGYAFAKEGHEDDALRAFKRSRELCDRCMTSEETTTYAALKNANK